MVAEESTAHLGSLTHSAAVFGLAERADRDADDSANVPLGGRRGERPFGCPPVPNPPNDRLAGHDANEGHADHSLTPFDTPNARMLQWCPGRGGSASAPTTWMSGRIQAQFFGEYPLLVS